MKDSKLKILLAGAGNMAWHLGPALQQAGYQVVQVYNRTLESAEKLGTMMGIPYTNSIAELSQDADMVLLSVSDEAIAPILENIQGQYTYMVHSSGSIPAAVFEGKAEHYGVFYPLMTFTVYRPLDFSSIPMYLESSSPGIQKVIEGMATSLSDRVYHIPFEKRKKLHLAAVIATNFSNHMYHLAGEYLAGEGLDFEMLKPVIRETAAKVMEMDPASAQTGPASRNDSAVVRVHIDLLKDHPELQKIYTFVSDSITNHFRA